MRRLSTPLAQLTDALYPYAYALIRITTGAMLVPHGWQKLFAGRLQGTADFMATVGLEPAMALATYIAVLELVGGTLLALGLLTRLVAVQVVGFMAVATFHVLWGKGFFWAQGGYEYSLLLGLLAVAIAIKGDAQIAIVSLHRRDELDEVFRHGGVGMVRRKGPVDDFIQQMMGSRQLRGDLGHGFARGAVAGVPGDGEFAPALIIAGHPGDVIVEHGPIHDAALTRHIVAGGGDAADFGDVVAVERIVADHEFEAVLIGRIVRARDHDAAVGFERINRVIEHWSRAEADAHDLHAALLEAFDQRRLERWRTQPAVSADADPTALLAPALFLGDARCEGPADSMNVRRAQSFVDDAPDVVFAKNRGVDSMSGHCYKSLGLVPRPTQTY